MSAPPDEMGGSVLRGGAWQTSSRTLSQLYTVVVSIVAARYLGAAGMGRLVFILYVYTTLVAVLASGLPLAVSRFTAELLGAGRPGSIPRLYEWARRIEAGGAALGGGILATIFLLGAQPGGAWLAATVACVASVMHTIPSAVLGGARRWRQASVVGLTTATVATVVKLALLSTGFGISALLTVDACVTVANLAGTSYLARRTLRHIERDPLPQPDLIRRARTYAITSTAGVVLSLVVLQRSEVFFLNYFSDDVQIAFYSIPFSAIETLNFLPAALALAAASAFATLFGGGAHDRMRSGFGRSTRLILLMTFPLAAAALVLGPDALRLAYGESYSDTGPVLVILVLPYPIVALMYMSTSVVQGFGRQRAPLLLLGVAAVVNLTLCFALIPPFEAIGAAAANALSQVVASVLLFTYARRLVGGVGWDVGALFRILATSTIAGAFALIPVVALPTLPGFVLGAGIFVVVLAGLAHVLRVIPAQDVTWLEGRVGSRFRGLGARVVRACAPNATQAT